MCLELDHLCYIKDGKSVIRRLFDGYLTFTFRLFIGYSMGIRHLLDDYLTVIYGYLTFVDDYLQLGSVSFEGYLPVISRLFHAC